MQMRELSTSELDAVNGAISFGFSYPGTGGTVSMGVSIGFGSIGVGFATSSGAYGYGFSGSHISYYAR